MRITAKMIQIDDEDVGELLTMRMGEENGDNITGRGTKFTRWEDGRSDLPA